MKRWIRGGIAAAALAAVAASLSAPAHAAPRVTLYGTDKPDNIKISFGGWGSGTANEDRNLGYRGLPTSIRLNTHGYYAGGRLVFDPPVDMTSQMTGPDSRNGFLEMIVNIAPPASADPFSGADPGTAPVPATRALRVVLVFDGGVAEVADHPVRLFPTGDGTWSSVAIPIPAFKGLDRIKSFKLREIRIFGDERDAFNIGEIRTTSDDEPIDVEPLENAEIAVNDTIEFRAMAAAGLSTLKFSWDFDASDGIQEDATGPVVQHTFRKGSPEVNQQPVPYRVTLTVTDVTGIKRPVTRVAEVTVNSFEN